MGGEPMTRYKMWFFLYLKGLAMGAADVVPGVSGGTIAFITGIYEELIQSLKNISWASLLVLKNEGIPAFWRAINGTFLLVLLLGIGTSLITLAHVITHLLDHYPVLLWSFFFGLIVASAVMVSKKLNSWNTSVIFSILLGAGIAYTVTVLSPSKGSESLLLVFVSGAIAICAMILPGISGAFILLLMGMYAPMITALKTLKMDVVLVFMAGCASGLIAFSRVLSWMFKHFPNQTIGLLSGFMIGSLNKVWPWKLTIESWTDHHGKVIPLVQQNISPLNYEALTTQSSHLFYAAIIIVLSFSSILLLEKCGHKKKEA